MFTLHSRYLKFSWRNREKIIHSLCLVLTLRPKCPPRLISSGQPMLSAHKIVYQNFHSRMTKSHTFLSNIHHRAKHGKFSKALEYILHPGLARPYYFALFESWCIVIFHVIMFYVFLWYIILSCGTLVVLSILFYVVLRFRVHVASCVLLKGIFPSHSS